MILSSGDLAADFVLESILEKLVLAATANRAGNGNLCPLVDYFDASNKEKKKKEKKKGKTGQGENK